MKKMNPISDEGLQRIAQSFEEGEAPNDSLSSSEIESWREFFHELAQYIVGDPELTYRSDEGEVESLDFHFDIPLEVFADRYVEGHTLTEDEVREDFAELFRGLEYYGGPGRQFVQIGTRVTGITNNSVQGIVDVRAGWDV